MPWWSSSLRRQSHGALVMLKVKGSYPGFVIYFLNNWQSLEKNNSQISHARTRTHVHKTFNFRWKWEKTWKTKNSLEWTDGKLSIKDFPYSMEWTDGTSSTWQLPILRRESFHGSLPVEDCLLQNGQIEHSPARTSHTLIEWTNRTSFNWQLPILQRWSLLCFSSGTEEGG